MLYLTVTGERIPTSGCALLGMTNIPVQPIVCHCEASVRTGCGNPLSYVYTDFLNINIRQGIPCRIFAFYSFIFSRSLRNRAASASEGIRKPVRGETVKLSTAGPSIRQERLNCWLK